MPRTRSSISPQTAPPAPADTRSVPPTPAAVRAPEAFEQQWRWEQDETYRYTFAGAFTDCAQGPLAGELLGKRPWQLAQTGVSQRAWNAHLQVLEARQPFRDFEFACLGANGQRRWFSVSGAPRFDASGAFCGYHGIAHDITRYRHAAGAAGAGSGSTERETSEAALREGGSGVRETDADLRRVLDAIPVAVARWDREQRYVYCNRKFAGDRGAEPEGILGRTIREVIGEAAYAAQGPLIERIAAGETVRYERSMQRSSGELRHFDVIGFPDRSGGPGLKGGYVVALDVTVQRNAQLALAASEQSLRALLANLPGYAYRCAGDRARTPEFASAGVEALTGYAAEDFAARKRLTFADLIHAEDRETVWEATQAAIVRGRPFELEYRITTREGDLKWLCDRGRGIFDAQGALLRIEGLVSDITESKRFAQAQDAQNRELERRVAERTAALAESEARLRAVVNEAPAGIATVGADGTLLDANQRFCEILGYSRTELVGKTYQQVTHPDDLPASQASTQEMIAGLRERYTLDKRYLRKDGGVVWINLSIAAVRGEGGEYRYAIAVVEDISERKRQVQALRASEAQLRIVTENIPAIVVHYDRESRCRYANTRYANAVGRPVDELIGLRFDEIVGAQRAREESARLQRAQSGQTVRFERTSHDGQGVTDVTLVPYYSSDGVQDGYFAFAVDITALKTAQAEVENLNVELEARVAARTGQLAEANMEMEAFSYSVSHDLRAPVRAMSGFAGILIEDHGEDLSDEARALVDRIAAAGARMGSMIDALLELARLSRSAPRPQPVDLAAAAREVWSEVIADEPHRLVVFTAPQRCIAECDPVLIRNVLQNLLGNAFKYTRRTPLARVEFGAYEAGGQTVHYVRDNGAGFDMAYSDKLFGTFQRLHTTLEFEGTGIGLATAQRIIARHGGKIWAEASLGEGASFQFTLGPAGTA